MAEDNMVAMLREGASGRGSLESDSGYLGLLHDAADKIERLLWELRSYEQIGGDAVRYSAIWREENPLKGSDDD